MLFTQLKQLSIRAISLSVLLLTLAGQEAYAANKTSYTKVVNHGESSGGKGNDPFTLKGPKVSGAACAVFVDASVDYKKRRFGEAKIVNKPAKGCNPAKQTCRLSVDWRHAPAGRLNYRITASWKIKSSGC
ncbi:MAG: hypothetical protein ACPGSM_03630 [Thiolinea sp.]